MKVIDDPALSDHLEQEVTGLVTCWIIEREDGEVFRFTDATEDLVVDGDTYSSVGAYRRTAIESTSSLSVDNLEIVGIAGDLSLPEQDLRNGLFDNARISVFMASWSAAVPGKIRLRRGYFGEVQTLPNGTFQVELRGLMQRLSYNYLDIFSPTCLYDLGEPACRVVIRPDEVLRSTAYAVGDTILAAKSSAPSFGKRYALNIEDASFEDLILTGFSSSPYWFNTGATDMVPDGTQAFDGTTSLKDGGGAGEAQQVLEIANATDMPIDRVESFDAKLNFMGYYRTNGSTARVMVEFLDEDFEVIEMSRAARTTTSHRYTDQLAIAGDYTATFWIKPDNDDRGGIMGGGVDGSGIGTEIVYQNEAIYFTSVAPAIDAQFNTPPDDGITKVYIGQWNHVAVIRSGATTSIYINFELMAQNSVDTYGSFTWRDLFRDSAETFTTYVLDNALLDDVRLYNVAKTYSELLQEAKNPPALPDANLLRWISFNDSTVDDQTGNDANSYGAGTGFSYETSGAPINGTGEITTGWDSGSANPGTTWTRFESSALTVPANTKQVRFRLIADGTEAWFDALSALLYDETENDTVFLPSDVDNLYWECTTAGTTAATYPVTYAGTAGATAVDGTATFTAREPWLRSGRVTTPTDLRVFNSTITESRALDGWFNGGAVIWVTGKNAGAVMEVKGWKQANGAIELFLSMPNEIRAGDEFFIYPGCDKSRVNCAAIFRNIRNFFGFPDVPGQDELFRYPDSR